jgi:peroxiredoxin
VAINRRLLAGSLGAAVVISLVGGYLVSRSDGSSGNATVGSNDVELDQPGLQQDPTIGTNAVVAGATLPIVDLETNAGERISTADLIGQPMIINVWFSTCAPCKRELPVFASVHADLGDQIRFVGVNPSLDSPETNQSFAAERGVTYELLRDPDGAFVDTVGITAYPVTLFVRADGTIARQTGELDEATLRADAEELLA